jgi:hypothetical protein
MEMKAPKETVSFHPTIPELNFHFSVKSSLIFCKVVAAGPKANVLGRGMVIITATLGAVKSKWTFIASFSHKKRCMPRMVQGAFPARASMPDHYRAFKVGFLFEFEIGETCRTGSYVNIATPIMMGSPEDFPTLTPACSKVWKVRSAPLCSRIWKVVAAPTTHDEIHTDIA